jgi:hypothetical protein
MYDFRFHSPASWPLSIPLFLFPAQPFSKLGSLNKGQQDLAALAQPVQSAFALFWSHKECLASEITGLSSQKLGAAAMEAQAPWLVILRITTRVCSF